MPWQDDNPVKGKLNIQLRPPTQGQTGKQLEDTIAAESLHMLGAQKPDGTPAHPAWWQLKQDFRKTLTPQDMGLAKQAWQEEQQSGEKRSFDDFMNQSYLDMFARGYIFPENQGQEWVDRKGKWPAQQAKVLDQMRALLEKQ
jgi:hypothetical protein